MTNAWTKTQRIRSPAPVAWRTDDELTFLAGLGRGEFVASIGWPSRRDLLRRYAAALDLRADWGNIDPITIRSALQLLLQED